MAAVLFTFKKPIPGREAQALKLGRDLVEYLESLLQSKQIDEFEPVLLGANAGEIDGLIFVNGPEEFILKLPVDPKIVEMLSRAYFCLSGHGVVPAYVGSKLGERVARLEALAKAS